MPRTATARTPRIEKLKPPPQLPWHHRARAHITLRLCTILPRLKRIRADRISNPLTPATRTSRLQPPTIRLLTPTLAHTPFHMVTVLRVSISRTASRNPLLTIILTLRKRRRVLTLRFLARTRAIPSPTCSTRNRILDLSLPTLTQTRRLLRLTLLNLSHSNSEHRPSLSPVAVPVSQDRSVDFRFSIDSPPFYVLFSALIHAQLYSLNLSCHQSRTSPFCLFYRGHESWNISRTLLSFHLDASSSK